MDSEARNRDQFVSVIVHLRDVAPLIEGFASELLAVLADRFAEFEVIFVDDASTDATSAAIDAILGRHERIRYLRLTRRFGREISVYAGMQTAIGDYVVILSIETDPPHLIPELVDRAILHGGVVFGTCKRRLDESALYQHARAVYVWLSVHLLGIPLVQEASGFMVFSRQASNALLEIKDRYRHVRVFSAYIGYTQESFSYTQQPRGRRVTRRPLLLGLGSGIQIVLANTSLPLRAVSWLGALAAVLCLLVVVAGSSAGTGSGDPTHASSLTLPVQLALMFAILAAVLAVQAEYLAALTEGTRNRPLYYIHEERTSSVLLPNRGRRNLTE